MKIPFYDKDGGFRFVELLGVGSEVVEVEGHSYRFGWLRQWDEAESLEWNTYVYLEAGYAAPDSVWVDLKSRTAACDPGKEIARKAKQWR